MFADQEEETSSSDSDNQQNTAADGNQYFDTRSEIHEIYWVACDANRRNGPQILNHDGLTVGNTDAGESGVVDDYRFFNNEKQELIEEITGEKDMYGLRKYREDFPEPDEEVWKEAASEHFGINIVGVHKIPTEQAMEEFNVDYSDEDTDPMYVPVIEMDDGEQVIYSPVDFYNSDETEGESIEVEAVEDVDEGEDEGTESEPSFPADADTVMEYLEEQPLDELTYQAKCTLKKLRDPSKVNQDIADEVGCSDNTVRKGLKKYLGDEGYDDLKERGKELRSKSGGESYEEKMAMSADGGEPETVEVDAEAFAELEGRIERLESMFDSELLDRI